MLQELTINIKPLHHLREEISLKDITPLWDAFSHLPFQHLEKQSFGLYCRVNPHPISVMMKRSYFYPPLPRHLVVGVVVTTDAEAKKLAGGALDLEPLNLQGTLEKPIAGLQVPVAAPQEMHAADGQEVSGGQSLQEGLELICVTKRERVRADCKT